MDIETIYPQQLISIVFLIPEQTCVIQVAKVNSKSDKFSLFPTRKYELLTNKVNTYLLAVKTVTNLLSPLTATISLCFESRGTIKLQSAIQQANNYIIF